MKRHLIAVSMLVVPLMANAQPDLAVELKGGPNAATFSAENRFNRYGVTGGVAGYLGWPLSDSFFIASQLELLYTPRGAKASFEGEYLGKFREHYVDLAFIARPSVTFGRVSSYLLLGGALNFLLNASVEDSVGAKEDITNDLRRFDVALLAGAGIAFKLPHRELGAFRLGTVFLEARYDHGLLNTNPMGGVVQNRTSSLMIGLSFALSPETSAMQPRSLPMPGEQPSSTAAVAPAE